MIENLDTETNESTPEPLVSILLVCYNFEMYFVEAIEAILAQDFDDYEIIVCDDFSTDGTRALASEYRDKFPAKVRLSFTTSNLGTTKNANQGFKLARGKYLCLTSGDDVFLPGKLSTQVRYMESNRNCVICYHDQKVFKSSNPEGGVLLSSIEQPRSGNVRIVTAYGTFAGGSSMMVRMRNPRVLLRPSIKYASDWLFQIDCLAIGGTIDYIPQVYAKYRRHECNVTVKHNVRNNIDNLRSIITIMLSYPWLSPWALHRLFMGSINVLKQIMQRRQFYVVRSKD
jgi:glycosyltransferase involved in cell wall biosynthesis